MTRYCFITGFLRSGTTLVEKLVHALPGACVGSQPFPFLYYDVKRAFLRERGIDDARYPLGHLFGEDRYRPEDFVAFLSGYRLTRESVAASFAAMRGYNGWQLPAMAERARDVHEGSFAEVYRALCDGLPSILGREASRLLGAKEVFCEEYVPYFLGEGISVVLVLRDVRDVLASLKFGRGANYGDPDLPLLHIVRQWRKSVAFALEFAGLPGFQVVRYERLVASSQREFDQLARDLGSPPAAPGAFDSLRDQNGRSWEGNSSFAPMQGISRDAVGRYASTLPATWLAAVESLCGPEMAAIGLDPTEVSGGADMAETLERVAKETSLVGPGAPLAAEIDAECQRSHMLERADASEADQRRWFIFPRAYQRLLRSGRIAV